MKRSRRVIQADSSSDERPARGTAEASTSSSASHQTSSSEEVGSEAENSSSEEEEHSSSDDEDEASSTTTSEAGGDEGESTEHSNDSRAERKARRKRAREKREKLRNQHTHKAVVQEGERCDLTFNPNRKFERQFGQPMVELKAGSNVWYQAYIIKESANEVKVKVPGVNGKRKPLIEWLNKGSSRIWRGSLRQEHWRHLGKGSWEPKVPAPGTAKKGRGSRGGAGSSGRRTQPRSAQHSGEHTGASVGCSTEQRSKPGQGGGAAPCEEEVMSPRGLAGSGGAASNPFKQQQQPRAVGRAGSTGDGTGSEDHERGKREHGKRSRLQQETGREGQPGLNGKQQEQEQQQQQPSKRQKVGQHLDPRPALSDAADHASTHSQHVAESPGLLADQNSTRALSSIDDAGFEQPSALPSSHLKPSVHAQALLAHHHAQQQAQAAAGRAAGSRPASQQSTDPLARWFLQHMTTLAATGMLGGTPEGSVEAGNLPAGFTYDPSTRQVLSLQQQQEQKAGRNAHAAAQRAPSPLGTAAGAHADAAGAATAPRSAAAAAGGGKSKPMHPASNAAPRTQSVSSADGALAAAAAKKGTVEKQGSGALPSPQQQQGGAAATLGSKAGSSAHDKPPQLGRGGGGVQQQAAGGSKVGGSGSHREADGGDGKASEREKERWHGHAPAKTAGKPSKDGSQQERPSPAAAGTAGGPGKSMAVAGSKHASSHAQPLGSNKQSDGGAKHSQAERMSSMDHAKLARQDSAAKLEQKSSHGLAGAGSSAARSSSKQQPHSSSKPGSPHEASKPAGLPAAGKPSRPATDASPREGTNGGASNGRDGEDREKDPRGGEEGPGRHAGGSMQPDAGRPPSAGGALQRSKSAAGALPGSGAKAPDGDAIHRGSADKPGHQANGWDSKPSSRPGTAGGARPSGNSHQQPHGGSGSPPGTSPSPRSHLSGPAPVKPHTQASSPSNSRDGPTNGQQAGGPAPPGLQHKAARDGKSFPSPHPGARSPFDGTSGPEALVNQPPVELQLPPQEERRFKGASGSSRGVSPLNHVSQTQGGDAARGSFGGFAPSAGAGKSSVHKRPTSGPGGGVGGAPAKGMRRSVIMADDSEDEDWPHQGSAGGAPPGNATPRTLGSPQPSAVSDPQHGLDKGPAARSRSQPAGGLSTAGGADGWPHHSYHGGASGPTDYDMPPSVRSEGQVSEPGRGGTGGEGQQLEAR